MNKKITINQFPLTKNKNQYQNFNESKFLEGLGEHSFGENKDQYGMKFKPSNSYKIYGTSGLFNDNNILEMQITSK